MKLHKWEGRDCSEGGQGTVPAKSMRDKPIRVTKPKGTKKPS